MRDVSFRISARAYEALERLTRQTGVKRSVLLRRIVEPQLVVGRGFDGESSEPASGPSGVETLWMLRMLAFIQASVAEVTARRDGEAVLLARRKDAEDWVDLASVAELESVPWPDRELSKRPAPATRPGAAAKAQNQRSARASRPQQAAASAKGATSNKVKPPKAEDVTTRDLFNVLSGEEPT